LADQADLPGTGWVEVSPDLPPMCRSMSFSDLHADPRADSAPTPGVRGHPGPAQGTAHSGWAVGCHHGSV